MLRVSTNIGIISENISKIPTILLFEPLTVDYITSSIKYVATNSVNDEIDYS